MKKLTVLIALLVLLLCAWAIGILSQEEPIPGSYSLEDAPIAGVSVPFTALQVEAGSEHIDRFPNPAEGTQVANPEKFTFLVQDQDGLPVSGVKVVVLPVGPASTSNCDCPSGLQGLTGDDGFVRFSNVPDGDWKAVAYEGFTWETSGYLNFRKSDSEPTVQTLMVARWQQGTYSSGVIHFSDKNVQPGTCYLVASDNLKYYFRLDEAGRFSIPNLDSVKSFLVYSQIDSRDYLLGRVALGPDSIGVVVNL